MAAGQGFKTFATGDVLTAADTNGYLMQGVWVFASAAARDAAVTSPQEGNTCYLKDTDNIMVYSGSAWVTKSATGGASGLTYITKQTAADVATLTFDSVFTATYTNYLIVYNGVRSTSGNTTADLYFQLRYAGPTTQSSTYQYGLNGVNSASTAINVGGTGQSQVILSRNLGNSTTSNNGQLFVTNTNAFCSGTGQNADAWGEEFLSVGFNQYTSRTYTGFLISTSAGNINGTFTLYGLANS